jgi:hypothetical protein
MTGRILGSRNPIPRSAFVLEVVYLGEKKLADIKSWGWWKEDGKERKDIGLVTGME